MGYLLLLLLGVVVAVAFLFWVVKREAKYHGTSANEEFIGICASAIETASNKEARKQKIIAMFTDKLEISNSEIRKGLLVSSRSVVRYMDELEREGKVEQIGKVGHTVTYRLK